MSSSSPSDSWPLLGRLKRAVKKITFLLNITATRWRVASFIGTRTRHLSFNDRPGLRAVAFDDVEEDEYVSSDVASSPVVSSPYSSGSSGNSKVLSRTASCPSSEDDVDKRAEAFIANFYRQLRIERQVSLELRYCRGNSFDSLSP